MGGFIEKFNLSKRQKSLSISIGWDLSPDLLIYKSYLTACLCPARNL